MDTAVSAADANRRFSELLRTVKKGRSVVVTSHGKPVAKITPVGEDERAAEGARSALFARLRTARALFADPVRRAASRGRLWGNDPPFARCLI
jgi:prevent-host-death family protein